MRAALNKACNDWEWIDRVPRVKALKGSRSRTRWITRSEADRLIAELPEHLAAMAEFSLQTGLHRRNVTHLKWSWVDLMRRTAWIPKEESKTRKAIAVPLSDVAVELLKKQLASQSESPSEWVFPHRGKPVTQTGSMAWRLALRRASIMDFCWHDLRHTWASWHVQSGTPLQVLQELGGWASITMEQDMLTFHRNTCEPGLTARPCIWYQLLKSWQIRMAMFLPCRIKKAANAAA